MSGHLLDHVLMFGRLLRALGLEIHVGRVLDAVRALDHIGIARRDDVHAALRAMLVHRHDDFALFDEAFDAFWRARRDRRGAAAPDVRSLGEEPHVEAAATPEQAGGVPRATAPTSARLPMSDRVAAQPVWSAAETLRTKDFARYTDEELVEAQRFLSALRWSPGERRTRRWRPGRGSQIDWRRVLRQTRQGGEIVTVPHRTPRFRPRPVIVLADVSGSMERYSRIMLRFAFCMARARGRVEAFVFATRLTRITHELGHGDIDAAARAAERRVRDWAGGTRIGDALGAFNRQWRGRLLRGGPAVLLISDGWDRGDPARLAREVALLQRSCHRLIWLNPLLGAPGYEPLTRGLKAALPYVDDFLPIHNLESLIALAGHLNALPPSVVRGAQKKGRPTYGGFVGRAFRPAVLEGRGGSS